MSVKPMNMPLEYREWVDSIDWEQAKVEHDSSVVTSITWMRFAHSCARSTPTATSWCTRKRSSHQAQCERKSWPTWTVEASPRISLP